MTRFTQTHGFTAKAHVEEVKNYIGRYPDVVIINSEKIPAKILKSYKEEVAKDLRFWGVLSPKEASKLLPVPRRVQSGMSKRARQKCPPR